MAIELLSSFFGCLKLKPARVNLTINNSLNQRPFDLKIEIKHANDF